MEIPTPGTSHAAAAFALSCGSRSQQCFGICRTGYRLDVNLDFRGYVNLELMGIGMS